MKMPTYRFMFVLGIFDVLPCIPHFITGIFTICQSVFHPILAESISVFGTPCYVAYCVITVILSINRFLFVVSPKYNEALFSAPVLHVWYVIIVLFWFVFALLLASPWASLVYSPQDYSWTYDFNLPLSSVVQKSAMGLELGCIVIFGFFYLCTLIVLYLTRKRFTASSKSKAELKILIQCIVIAAYCAVMNTLWHQSQMFPSNLWCKMVLNFMWVVNSAVYPTIYFIVNRRVHEEVIGEAWITSKLEIPELFAVVSYPRTKRF
ncbi:hypothetical protein ANCCAN_14386 [Ancylostoma caninum]|uniref:Serpentine receptor class gamma n=1 Tax=Ancylostoma caninum TaxID=29170 RepID=A0A368GAB5_ANCCA|nr:hypothetical protein ANCCAN_14386 [Ancylostoma caninum]